MNCLGAVAYDPGTAATASTASALAMTALDTTNIRITFTAPASGIVKIIMRGIVHGAASQPVVLFGVLEGASVVKRASAWQISPGGSALTMSGRHAEFCVTGLTPGNSYTYDAAYGVETAVASSALKWGGPNDTTNDNAFGAFVFEIWDPCPIYQNDDVPTSSLDDKVDVIDDLIDTEVGAIKTKTDSLTFTVAGKVDANVTHNAGTAITSASGRQEVNLSHIAGSAVSTTTAQLGVNVVQISGDPASADNLEAATDGTGYNVGNGSIVAASVTGAVGSVTGNVGGNVAGSVASVTAAVTVGTNNDKTGYRLSSTGVDDVLDEAVEGTRTFRQMLRGFASALLGKGSGLDTTTAVYRDIDDSKDRITATVDANGNRTAITLDLT